MSRRLDSMRLAVLTTLLGAAWLVLPSAAHGQPIPGSTTPNPGVTPERQAVLDARKQLATDQGEHAKRIAELNLVVTKLRQVFNTSPEMVEATAAQKKAQSAYAAAKAKVLESLRTKPEYVAAVAIRDQARQKLKELQESNAQPDQITLAAEARLAAETTVDKMENEAYEADAATKEAKSANLTAGMNLSVIRRKFDEDLKTNPDYAAAKSAVETAAATVKTDQANVTEKIKAENAARANKPYGG